MSTVNGLTVDILTKIAAIQEAIGEGAAANLASILGIADLQPSTIKSALDRGALNSDVHQLVDRALGDAMTAGDEASILATFERAMQSCYMSRTRRIAHHLGRCRGQADPQGILRYGLPEMISRPG